MKRQCDHARFQDGIVGVAVQYLRVSRHLHPFGPSACYLGSTWLIGCLLRRSLAHSLGKPGRDCDRAGSESRLSLILSKPLKIVTDLLSIHDRQDMFTFEMIGIPGRYARKSLKSLLSFDILWSIW